MNKYNSVPNIRFKGFENEWKNLKLGELSEIARGASPRPINNKKWFSKNSKIGWLRISDVTEQNGRIFYLKQKLSIQGQKKTRVIKTKHLLLSIAATVGSPVINYIPTGVHDGFLIFYNPKFDIEFMFQWLQKYRKNWSKFGQPGSQVNLNSEIVRNQKVYIPEEKEERYIANLFLKIDRSLNLQQQKIDKLELLKKALLQKLFPKHDAQIPELRFKGFNDEWKNDSIKNISTMKSGGTPSVNKREYYVGDIPFIRSSDIKKKTTELKINDEALKNSSSFVVEKGTVLYALYGATSGQVAISKVTGAINQAVLAIFPDKFVNKYFLLYWLSFNKGKITNKYLQGGQGNLSAKIVKNLLLFFPTKPEQQKIGNLLSKVDQLIELENKKLQNFQQVKKCLLQNMFVE